jgi:hypothetical protein
MQKNMVHAAASFVRKFYDEHQDARLVFHNYQLAHQTAALVVEIAQADHISAEETEAAALAAWFLPLGLSLDYRHPLTASLQEMGRFFLIHPYPDAQRIKVVQTLQTIGNTQPPASAEERLLNDAFFIAAYLIDSENRSALLKLEWKLVEKREFKKMDWLELRIQQLLKIKLQKHYSKLTYEPQLAQQLLALTEEQSKAEKKQIKKGDKTRFQYAEEPDTARQAQSFFRINYRNHINLSSIADNKANIMISVNAILISVMISFLSYRNAAATNPMILLPVVIFLVTGLASLIFAVLSARPKVTNLNSKTGLSKTEIVRNVVFFGNFVPLSVDDYEEAMDTVFRDSELYIGNLTRDLYFLGKVLDKKYRFLTASYNIFMVGFVATVITFLWVLFA